MTSELQSNVILFEHQSNSSVYPARTQHHYSQNYPGYPTSSSTLCLPSWAHKTGYSHSPNICSIILHSMILIPHIFFSYRCSAKVVVDAGSNSANSTVHSQGTPGGIHKTTLFDAAAVSIYVLSPAAYHVRTSDQTANSIFTALPWRRSNLQKHSSDITLSPTSDISFCLCTLRIIYLNKKQYILWFLMVTQLGPSVDKIPQSGSR